MSIRAKSSLIIVIAAVAVTLSCGKKDSETTSVTSAPAPPPLPAGISQSLTHNPEAPFYNFDNLGPVNYPAVQKGIQVSGDTDIAVTGWALDLYKKGPAGGVDVVIDNVPHSARYGMDRTDVAAHFKRPEYTKCGFQLTVGRGQLPKGQHSISVRVISSDLKSYNEGPVVQFTVI